MFKPYLLLPSLLIACGDNLHQVDETIDPSVGEHDDHPTPDAPDAPPRAIDADIYIEPVTCASTIARFEAGARYVDDNSPALDIACKWTFDDGSTSTDCAGEHPFATAGAHDFVLEVTDLATGATNVATQTRFFEPPLAVTLDVTANDLSITYSAFSNTGGEQIVRVSPEALVVSNDPNYPRSTSGTVRVLEAGTYTVTYEVEDERGIGEICAAKLEKTVTAVCSGEGHVH